MIPSTATLSEFSEGTFSLIPGSETAQLVEAGTYFSLWKCLNCHWPTRQNSKLAREEAKAALSLASEASKKIAKVTDAMKRKKLEDAIQKVQMYSKSVNEAAELVAKNPFDKGAQDKLAKAQNDLNDAVKIVMTLENEIQHDKSIDEALKAMNKEEGSIATLMNTAQLVKKKKKSLLWLLEGYFGLKMCSNAKKKKNKNKKALDKLSDLFAKMSNPNLKLSPQETISMSKEMSSQAQDIWQQFREMANKIEDPIFKEKLLNSAKIIKDNGMQVKILGGMKWNENENMKMLKKFRRIAEILSSSGMRNEKFYFFKKYLFSLKWLPAVRAADSTQKDNPVLNAMKTMQTTISNSIKEVQAEQIRTRFKTTVAKTAAINKVVKTLQNKWKNCSTRKIPKEA